MSRSGRAAVYAVLRLVLLVAGAALLASWWWRQREPDFVVDRVVRLTPEPLGGVGPRVPVAFRDVERSCWELRVDEVLHFRVTVPGDDATLRFDAAGMRGRPELVVSVVDRERRHREVARTEVADQAFSRHRVPLPVEGGASVVVEVTAKDGRGRPGIGLAYLSNVALESAGRPVDETRIPVRLEGIVADLLAQEDGRTRRAPRTTVTDRYGLPGPPARPLEPGVPLRLETPDVPPGARLRLTVHAGGFLGPDARLIVRLDGEPLGRVPLELADAATPELAVDVDLDEREPGPLSLELRLDASDEGFVGLREVLLLAPQEVARRPFRPERGRNCLLVVVEGLRRDRLGVAGYARGHTPVVDELARRGVRFEQAYANAPWARPSLASLLTGTPPLMHGMGRPGVVLSPRILTLPQIASWGGRTTACFSNSAVLEHAPSLQRGFETCLVVNERAPQVVERFADWLADARQFEWFAMLHLADAGPPHAPLMADLALVAPDPDPQVVARLRPLDSRPGVAESAALESNAYDAELAGVDGAIGDALAALEAAGLREATRVIVTSDHGVAFYEHGTRHDHTLHDEALHVPLVVGGGGVSFAPHVEATPVDLVDAASVVLRAAGLAPSDRMRGALPPPWGPLPTNPIHHALVRPFPGVTGRDADASRRGAWLRIADHVTGEEALFARDHDPRALENLLAGGASARARAEADALATAFAEWARASLGAAPAHARQIELAAP